MAVTIPDDLTESQGGRIVLVGTTAPALQDLRASVGAILDGRYSIEERALRGRLVRLGGTIDAILNRHDYPEPVAMLLGEALVLANFFKRSRIGSMKAAVLPVPVCAAASRSRPDSTSGMALAWIGVGSE